MKNMSYLYYWIVVLSLFTNQGCKNEVPELPSLTHGPQIIADHTVVDLYDKIPQFYLNKVKEMWLTIPGESHSRAYLAGLERLASKNSLYKVKITGSGTPESFTDEYLRATKATWGDFDHSTGWIFNYGEEDWFTNSIAVERTKAGITYCNEIAGLIMSAIGFAWCNDMIGGYATSGRDPVYDCRWMGSSQNGPDGDKAWGIDREDFIVTNNSVSLATYLEVTQEYIDYCKSKEYPTKVFFTTGPVDLLSSWEQENGYQGHLKHEQIRKYVKSDSTRILFDYADILCYDDNGLLTTMNWNGYTYPAIAPTNEQPVSSGHISELGSIRLAKAMWWMLARISGWDGR